MEIIVLALLGLLFGSFVTALTWRLHEGKDFVVDRSECEHCHHKLAAADLVPLFSWLALKGKCRYCHKSIGWHNPLIEISLASAFVLSYIFWPEPLTTVWTGISFGIWLFYIVLLAALFVYDLRWMLLPNKLVFPLIGLGIIDAVIRVGSHTQWSFYEIAQHIVLGAGALGGIYGLLYIISKGKWVGFGDVKLGFFMGAVLGWPLALLTLFLANIIGCLWVGPGLLTHKLTPKSQVPFGPFLIVSFFIAGLVGQHIIQWYFGILFL